MDNITANHPLIKILKHFENGNRTDIDKRTITNSDVIALCLYVFGPFGLKELRRVCGLWKGARAVYCGEPGQTKLEDRTLDSYFTPHYGYTATALDGRTAYTGLAGKRNRGRRYWYRQQEHTPRTSFPGFVQPAQRYKNALTCMGLDRAERLLDMMNECI